MNDHAFGLMNNYNNMIERDYEKELQEWLLKKSHTEFVQKDDNCNSFIIISYFVNYNLCNKI